MQGSSVLPEPNSRLWRGANDATVAVLYYDWVRKF